MSSIKVKPRGWPPSLRLAGPLGEDGPAMTSLDSFKRTLGDDSGRRLLTALLVLLALASALAWWTAARHMQTAPPMPLAPSVPAPAVALLSAGELARLLGASAAAPQPAPAQRFQVLGVIAGRSGQGAALIAVDGQPARPFGVGAEVAPGFVLKRLATRAVMLADSVDAPVKLSLPLPEWEPRSAPGAPAAGTAPGAEAAAPAAPGVPAGEPAPAQPPRRGDQRGP